jgi:hypothetical protein
MGHFYLGILLSSFLAFGVVNSSERKAQMLRGSVRTLTGKQRTEESKNHRT